MVTEAQTHTLEDALGTEELRCRQSAMTPRLLQRTEGLEVP